MITAQTGENLKITDKRKKAAYLVAAVAIFGLASFGIYNTANAISDFNRAGPAIISNSPEKNDPVNGSGCSPYGCAACSACTKIPYQQNIEVVPESALQYE
jgi:hypothetical protein